MQALYAYELGGDDAQHVIATIIVERLKGETESIRFATSLFLRCLDLREEADEIVVRYTKHWALSRIALIDRILMRVAICEMLLFEDIPPKVTINEAIEVAKRFSTAKSGQFINGILDAVLIDFQRDGRLKKSGTGLIGIEDIQKRAARRDGGIASKE